jgi:hypothetical protein
MLPQNHRRHVALGLVLAAGALPASAAARTDTPAHSTVSPAASSPGIDLRSPDARDAAAGIDLRRTPVPQVEVVQASSSSGFDWGDAGIGAGGAVGIVLLALGGTVAVVRHRGGSINPLHPTGFAH